ncbi:MBOAT family O-acyltransferase [Pseudomonas mohnii]
MNYFSIEFGLCFLLFFVLYWSVCWSTRLQNLLLLTASYGILATFSLDFLCVLLGYTAVVYLLGRLCARYPGRSLTWLLILLIIVIFFYCFKYQDFFASGMQSVFQAVGLYLSVPVFQVLLPVGLSFYVFHSVSYLVSINRSELNPAAPHDLALYLAFFPSLIAGPVNRATDFLPQIRAQGIRQILNPYRALGLIALATVKLFLLSSWLANEWVDPIFDTPTASSPEQILLAVYGYSFQIYFNFSGYTNLVTGIALLLGFRLPENFNYPYLAHNLKEFWARWHISLSRFIRDYIYIPLGGNRQGALFSTLYMLVAMLISGLWHGASANFLVWGALHGVGLALYRLWTHWRPERATWPGASLLARLLTFHYIALAWIFFRSSTLGDAFDLIKGLTGLSLQGLSTASGLRVLACLTVIVCYPSWVSFIREMFAASLRIPAIIYPIALGLFLCVIIFASPSGVPSFIYASF